MTQVETADRPASFTRRAGLRKAIYIAPTVVAIQMVAPTVTLGRSGRTSKPTNPGSPGKDKPQGPKK